MRDILGNITVDTELEVFVVHSVYSSYCLRDNVTSGDQFFLARIKAMPVRQ